MTSSQRKKISVITTTYNLLKGGRKKAFLEMFKSVHNQTYPNIEHLIIDGGSQDGTLEFIDKVNKKYGKKELVIFSEKDEGITDATLKGFRKSSGEYVIIMCSDDYYMRNDALELLADAIEENNVDYACGDGWWLFRLVWKADIDSFVYRHPFLINAWLVKRQVFEKYGHFNKNYKVLADYELFFRILSKPDIKGIEVHKTVTCLRPGGFSSQEDIAQKYIADLIPVYRTYFNKDCCLSEYDCKILHFTHPSDDLVSRIRRYEDNPQILKSFEKGINYERPNLHKLSSTERLKEELREILKLKPVAKSIKKLFKKKKAKTKKVKLNQPSMPANTNLTRRIYKEFGANEHFQYLNRPFCTGCSACVSSCGAKALTLQQDMDGFYKPLIDTDKCTKCGKCEIVCPLNNSLPNKNLTEPPLYVFNNNTTLAQYSATAGGFQIIAKDFIARGGKVAGAVWGKDWRCEHILVDNEKDLKKLYKSKYVQSYMGDIFKQIKSELAKGTLILFSGLPCQIAGLKAYLGKEYDNLYTVDLLCNNAPSPQHFRSYLEDSYGLENIETLEFRHKPQTGTVSKNILQVKLKDGQEILSELWSDQSYCQAFVNRQLVGDHCEHCAFAKLPRIADLTIGDIFGAESIDSRFQGLKSESVLINSAKGKNLFSVIQNQVSEIRELPLQILINMHPVLKQKWSAHKDRNRLFDLLQRYPFNQAYKLLNKKFDVGIVGVPTNPNFGGGLTYLALKWALEDMGKTCLMISPPGEELVWLPKKITNFKENPYKSYELAFYNTKENMDELNYRCEMFLIGSDQLYSTHFPNIGIYGEMDEYPSLDWVWDSKKKAAYSASFGQDEIICPEDMKNRMGYYLRKFDNFSVRERSAVDLCKKEFGIDAAFILDPVFMCEKQHWDKLISKGKAVSGITAYVLDKTQEKQRLISQISQQLDLPVNIIGDAAVDMEDWVASLASADFIITDSFHGMCFAIIFNKPFVVVANPERGMARFRLLKEFDLMDRMIQNYHLSKKSLENLLQPVDWEKVNKKLYGLKQQSHNILVETLEAKKKFPSDYDILYEKWLEQKKH